MQYPVLLSKKNGQYSAVVPWLPDCAAQGRTRDEVLANLRAVIERTLTDIEITTVEVQGAENQAPSNVWLETAGLFETDPLFDEMLAEVAAARQRTQMPRDT